LIPILEADRANIFKAARLLKAGKLIAFPTETVYGLGADAFNPDAVARIFEIKRRPRFDPLIVHVAHFQSLPRVAGEIPRDAELLMEKFWPGPLTLVLPKNKALPDLVCSGLSTVAVRMPSHPVALSLISLSDTPVAAPSANPFGSLSPTEASQVAATLKYGVELILDGGHTPLGLESTIVKLEGGQVFVLRPGAVTMEELEKVTGKKPYMKAGQTSEAPGGFGTHYAPRTPLYVVKAGQYPNIPKGKRAGLLAFANAPKNSPFEAVQVMSPGGDLTEAAKNFFSHLFWLDNQHLDMIVAEEVPAKGLGYAILDRLKKASRHR
jgi:L-threonylcarbamoyladenylate synthase